MSEYPPSVLSRVRRTAVGTAAGLPITVNASSQATVTIPLASCLEDLSSLSHTRVRARVYSTTLSTDAGGAVFIGIESANLQTGSQQVVQPCTTGSALGAYNAAALQGELEFDTDDSPISSNPPSALQLVIVVNNTDSGAGHQVTGATATVIIEATQYQDQYIGTVS